MNLSQDSQGPQWTRESRRLPGCGGLFPLCYWTAGKKRRNLYSHLLWNQDQFRSKDLGISSSWLPEPPLVDRRAGMRSAALCVVRPSLEIEQIL